ncbi:RNA exonuclease 4 [Diplocarpon rosae]|nr:RNA exonuclease 4 [Diplocarpon rosae]
MLALQKSPRHRGKCTPSVLPCRINHNVAVNTAKRYWNPVVSDGTKTAYFRGRKLHGKTLSLPPSHRGVVAATTDRILPVPDPTGASDRPSEAEEEEEPEPEVKIIEEQASFDEIVVWGHEVLPHGMADPYVRGMEDWIAFAEQVCAFFWVVVEVLG